MRGGRLRRSTVDLCVSVCNWRQRKNLWADICSWFFGDNKSGFFLHWCASTLLSLSLVCVPLCITHTRFPSSSPPHFLNSVETQGLVAQKTLESASLFGWPHELSCESSFLAKASSGRKGKECKKERPALWLSASRGGWRQRGVNRLQLRGSTQSGKTCNCLCGAQFLLTAPISTIHGWVNREGSCHWAISLHINFLSSHSLNTRFRAQWLLFLCFDYPSSCYTEHNTVWDREGEKIRGKKPFLEVTWVVLHSIDFQLTITELMHRNIIYIPQDYQR